MQREQKKFVDERRIEGRCLKRARKSRWPAVPHELDGEWAGAFSAVRAGAKEPHLLHSGHSLITDFCLGDTGAMTGHSPFANGQGRRRAVAPRHHADAAGGRFHFCSRELQKRLTLPYGSSR